MQYDNLIISNDRRKLEEEVRRQANELNLVKQELLSAIKEKAKLKSALGNLKSFFNVVLKNNKEHCDLLE